MDPCIYRFGLHHATYSRGFHAEITSRDVSSYSEASFARFQRRSIERELRALVDACRRKLSYSFCLLNPAAPWPAALDRPGCLDRMIIPWDRLCVFYRRNRLDPQLDFFDCHTLREGLRWRDFIEATCTAPFTSRYHWTRSLLEGAAIIPHTPHSTSIPIEELFDAILSNLEGKEHEHDWLI
jgi:hypothetical protein